MSAVWVPGGCIPERFVVDLGCLVCGLEDPRALGVILGEVRNGRVLRVWYVFVEVCY